MDAIDRIMHAMRRLLPAPDQVICRMKGGYAIALHPNADAHERQLFDARTYEAATLALFDSVLRSGDTMVDVGANLGLMTIHAAKRVGLAGVVVSVEPHPIYYPRLVQNIALNNLKNVCPIQVAAGALLERRAIYDVPDVNIGRSSLILPDVKSNNAGTVPVDRLDAILDRVGVDAVRLLKIDVEGFESRVLEGAPKTLAKLPVICMEVTSAIPQADGARLAAHDTIMSSGIYASYKFTKGKEKKSPLVRVTERSLIERMTHENVIYIPHALRRTLPAGLFVD